MWCSLCLNSHSKIWGSQGSGLRLKIKILNKRTSKSKLTSHSKPLSPIQKCRNKCKTKSTKSFTYYRKSKKVSKILQKSRSSQTKKFSQQRSKWIRFLISTLIEWNVVTLILARTQALLSAMSHSTIFLRTIMRASSQISVATSWHRCTNLDSKTPSKGPKSPRQNAKNWFSKPRSKPSQKLSKCSKKNTKSKNKPIWTKFTTFTSKTSIFCPKI